MILSLALIGGSGCITASIVSQARADAYRREREKTEQADSVAKLATYRAAAANGDPAASVQLAQALIRPVAGVEKYDTAQALQLLEQASQKGYGQADYVLGWIYLNGSTVPRQPERGVTLLKQAASRACTYYRDTTRSGPAINVASEISRLYLQSRIGPQDKVQADLWRARSAVHCPRSYPAPQRYATQATPATPAIPDALMWARFDPNADKAMPQIAELLKVLAPPDIAAAEEKERQLRRAVIESERQYPAPPTEK